MSHPAQLNPEPQDCDHARLLQVLERIQSALDDKSAIKKMRSQILDEIQQVILCIYDKFIYYVASTQPRLSITSPPKIRAY